MSNTNTFGTWFSVYHPVVVDHPELRCSTFPVVQAGTVIPSSTGFARQKNAIRFAEQLLKGDNDFSSEYVRAVQVLQHYPNRSARVVRKRVERERIPGTDRARTITP